MAVILPFEKSFYEQHSVPVSFVGHPLMDSPTGKVPLRKCTAPHRQAPLVGLLPGSRVSEVRSLLPIMLRAGQCLQHKIECIRFVISCAPSIDVAMIRSILTENSLRQVEITHEPVSDLFPRCDLAVVASGTVTLEAAICGTPMIITYAVSPMSYWLGRALIKVDHIGLVNLIAQKRIVPELVQKQASPESICEIAYATLTDTDLYAAVCKDLAVVRERLGFGGASTNVARIACSLMERHHDAG